MLFHHAANQLFVRQYAEKHIALSRDRGNILMKFN